MDHLDQGVRRSRVTRDTTIYFPAMLDHLDQAFFRPLDQRVTSVDPNDPTLRGNNLSCHVCHASRHGACVRLLSRDKRPASRPASRPACVPSGMRPDMFPPSCIPSCDTEQGHSVIGLIPRKCVRIALYEGNKIGTYNPIPYPVPPHTAQYSANRTKDNRPRHSSGCRGLLSLHTKKAGILPAPCSIQLLGLFGLFDLYGYNLFIRSLDTDTVAEINLVPNSGHE